MQALEKAARHYESDVRGLFATVDILIHGTTLATNTLITGKGVKTGMITTKNFRDILELRRGIKPIDISHDKRRRRCRFDGKDIDTPVYDGDRIRAGNVLTGPAIVEESTMTVVVPKGFRCQVDPVKNYILTRTRKRRS